MRSGTHFQSAKYVFGLMLFCSVSLRVVASDTGSIEAFSFTNNKQQAGLSFKSDNSGSNSSTSSIKTWDISLNKQLALLDIGDEFTLPTPAGNTINATVISSEQLHSGDIQIVAEYDAQGRVLLTIGNNIGFGNIISAEHSFNITINGNGQQMLVDNATIPADAMNLQDDFRLPDVPRSKTAKRSQFKTMAESSTSLTEIDLMVVYSREFRQVFTSPTTRINQLVSFSNAAYQRSGILIKLRLVAAIELPFNNASRTNITLDQVTNGTGVFASVAGLRNRFGADMVAVLHGEEGFSASGVAWINGDVESFSFSSTRLSTGCCDVVFAHELGHNFGSGHERQSVNSGQSNPCVSSANHTGFSCGHGNLSRGWGTIMSSIDSNAVNNVFSNLDANCLGEPCGIASGQANAADNRTSFNMTRFLVANFRPRATIAGPGTTSGPGTNTSTGWLPAIMSTLDE